MMEHCVNRRVRYRLLPRRKAVWRRLERVLEAQRQLYNAALLERDDCYRKTGRSVTRFAQFRSLTDCRRDIPGMADVPVAIQRGTLQRLDEAFKGFFRRVKAKAENPGYPRFQGRRHWDSFSVVAGVILDESRPVRPRLKVPGFGWLTLRWRGGNPYPDGIPVSAVLKREAGKWYAVVCLRVVLPERVDDGRVRGLDMNAGQVAFRGGGRVAGFLHAPDTRRRDGNVKRLARRLAVQKRGSKRRERTRRRLAYEKGRIARIKRNWRHHASRALAGMAHTVVLENLKTKAMTSSAKGTVDEPGRNVAAKAGLNRVILETGWSEMRSMLEYKAGQVVAVPPRNTSRTCHECGHVSAASRRTQADFHCVACGHAANADLNAAANIRRLGMALLSGQEGRTVRPDCSPQT